MVGRALGLTAVAVVTAAIIAAVASCSHGSYDGSYEGGAAESGASLGDAGTVVTQTVAPGKDTVVTNGVLEVTIPNGAYAAPVTVTIAQLDDRTADTLIVPTFSVAVVPTDGDPTPKLPVQLVFNGSAGGTLSTTRVLVPAVVGADGTTTTPLTIAGVSASNLGGGSTAPFWGLTTTFGTFTLVFESVAPDNDFSDVDPTTCLSKCCGASPEAMQMSGNGLGAAAAVGGGCVCAVGPSLPCFIQNCPDIAKAATRCQELATPVAGTVACRALSCATSACKSMTGPPTCAWCNGGTDTCFAEQCCASSGSDNCGTVGNGSGGNTCNGMTVRCASDANCPTNTVCCAFANDTHCTATCPDAQRLCTPTSDCDGGVCGCDGDAGPCACQASTCVPNRLCPFGTCGTAPAACQ